jgi:hypothetical protein
MKKCKLQHLHKKTTRQANIHLWPQKQIAAGKRQRKDPKGSGLPGGFPGVSDTPCAHAAHRRKTPLKPGRLLHTQKQLTDMSEYGCRVKFRRADPNKASFARSPVIYGNRVETFGPYPRIYTS